MKVVIIGAGVAGIKAAETIRRNLPESRITVVSKEPVAFYSRPGIYKIVTGEKEPGDLIIYPDKWFNEMDVEFLKGVEAKGINIEEKSVNLSQEESLKYDRLILATGSKPFIPPIDGISLKGIHGFYTLEDAVKVSADLHKGCQVVVVGAGPVGVKVAESIVKRYGSSVKVTLVEKLDRPLPRLLDEETGRMMKKLLEDKGIKLRLGQGVKRFEGEERVETSILEDGERVECDLAVISVGVRPNVDLARQAGMRVGRGVLVKPTMETSVPGVYAAGDVAEVEGYEPSINPVWPAAFEQGVTAGLNIAGTPSIYRGLPLLNAAEIFGIPLISFGKVHSPPPGSRIHVYRRGDSVVKIVSHGERIIGAIFLGEEEGAGTVFNMVAGGLKIPGLEDFLATQIPSYGALLGVRGIMV